MNNIVEKKLETLKSILNSYASYKGGFRSVLEPVINKLKEKLNPTDYAELKTAYERYTDDLLTIIANTRRVFVRLDENIKTVNFADFDNIFEDLDD